MAQALLQLHVRGYLVERHMPGALHHHLHAGVPRALRKLADLDKLGDLTRIGRIERRQPGRMASPMLMVTSCSCKMASTSS